jgi:hypothetical protein
MEPKWTVPGPGYCFVPQVAQLAQPAGVGRETTVAAADASVVEPLRGAADPFSGVDPVDWTTSFGAGRWLAMMFAGVMIEVGPSEPGIGAAGRPCPQRSLGIASRAGAGGNCGACG